MYPDHLPLAQTLKQAHAQTWQDIAKPGDFFTATQRTNMVQVAREALTCELCATRKSALSPYAVEGTHDGIASLDPIIIDMIHRLRTDPGRLTKRWFDTVICHISTQEYVEIISVVTSSVIVDTLHNALGLGLPVVLDPARGKTKRLVNTQAIDGGAWVPILAAPDTMADTGLPEVPNITRALGLLPSALALFFNTFRPHYALKNIDLSISQAQAEFVAARVSAMNECFY